MTITAEFIKKFGGLRGNVERFLCLRRTAERSLGLYLVEQVEAGHTQGLALDGYPPGATMNRHGLIVTSGASLARKGAAIRALLDEQPEYRAKLAEYRAKLAGAS